MEVSIIRLEKAPDGLFGAMLVDGKVFCVTVENTIALIPCGTYTARRYFSPARQEQVWQLLDVEGRSFIQIHPANKAGELLGCIAVGQYWGKLHGTPDERAVLNSGNTFHLLMDMTKDEEEITVVVSEHYHGGTA